MFIHIININITFCNLMTFLFNFFRQNYVFTCRCIKCEEQINDPDITSDDDSEMEDDK